MAIQNIQPMPASEQRSDPTSTSARWTRWPERFNTYLVAADIKDDGRKRALLLPQRASLKRASKAAILIYICG